MILMFFSITLIINELQTKCYLEQKKAVDTGSIACILLVS